jgi:predicted phosphodiesterase
MEFSEFILPELETDKDDVLILAGDIGVARYAHTFGPIKNWSKRFRKIVQIAGNHEYYHGSLLRSRAKIQEFMGDDVYPVWKLAENEIVRVDNVSFICATLWTDFNRGNPIAKESVRSGLNDYRLIRTGDSVEPYQRRIKPNDILNIFIRSKQFIFESIAKEKSDGKKTVVVTHHAPTELSIDRARYGNNILNWGYVSNMFDEIYDNGPDFWVHGHTHTSFKYEVGKTKVISNPRGYAYPMAPPENTNFDPILRIEV